MDRKDILRSYGTEYREMTKELLKEADIAAEIREKAENVHPKIGIKPNLVCPTPAEF